MNRHLAAALALLALIAGSLALLSACTTSNLTPEPIFAPSPGPAAATATRPRPAATATRPRSAATATPRASIGSIGNTVAPNAGGGLPANAPQPPPPPNTYEGCPSVGDGGDPQLNARKNRTDSAPWYPVSIGNILALPWPGSIERRNRANWSAADAAAIARYEGIPVQIEGWLAGAKQQGPESCNCHSPDDVDNHLWIVDAPGKGRDQSLVIEVTPRLRAQHPGWAFARIRPLVDGKTKVRISGWLMLDQEHPDQVGKTRGSIWEIHPIIGFDVQQGTTWVSLDTGRVVPTEPPGAAPTEDPSLPPPIVETPEPGSRPTPTPHPGDSGGAAGTGAVQIRTIFYNGDLNPSEPDEYVEIANQGPDAVNLAGWVLRDVYGGQEFAWPDYTLQPGQRIRVYTNQVHADTGGFSFGSGAAIWRNDGDAAELQDAEGAVISTYVYGDKR